jgi:putative transposase
VSNLLQEIKKSSSAWIKDKGSFCRNFSWQAGYGVFSIGRSEFEALLHYIDNQQEHHRRRTFKEELLGFLRKYNVQYDEKYLFS